MKNSALLTTLFILFGSCTATSRDTSIEPPSHQLWNELLQKHVTADGIVNYNGFIRDRQKLGKYLELLSSNAPDKSWSEGEKLAYWINAYNAFTVKLIIDNYPLGSIQDLHPTLKIPGINTVWHKKFFTIGGKEASLDEIEHDILRKEFEEPRIHFAINCASFSCPPLKNEAFLADKINEQLEEQARSFINDPKRNQISSDHVEISKIFKWFTKDFTREGSLIDFLNKYSRIRINQDAEIDYMDYDWDLNERN